MDSSQDSQPLPYTPLPAGCIRLLCIAMHLSDMTCGDLKVVALDEAPSYHAISYSWGCGKAVCPISVNGATLYISMGLASGIRRLQELTAAGTDPDLHSDYVWIDAICINQKDSSERSQQVQLMGQIYSHSLRTLIWLGSEPDPPNTIWAWPLIDQLYDIFRAESPAAKASTEIQMRLYSDSRHAVLGLPGWTDNSWEHLRNLLSRPWFTRTWAIQEVVLSPRDPFILYGQHVYPWHRLAWVASWLRRNGYLRLNQVPNQILNVDMVANIRNTKGFWHLDALLCVTSMKFRASDQRDKVYGLLGLASETQDSDAPPALRPDYGLSVQQLFRNVAMFLFQRQLNLATLTRVSGTHSLCRRQRRYTFDGMPSWIPDWSDFNVLESEIPKPLPWVLHNSDLKPPVLGFPKHFKAAADLPIKLHPSEDEQLLQVHGLTVDSVVYTNQFNDTDDSNGGPDQKLESLTLKVWSDDIALSPVSCMVERANMYIETTTTENHILTGRTAEEILKCGSGYIHDLLAKRSCELFPLTELRTSTESIRLLKKASAGGEPEVYAALAHNFCFSRTFFITAAGRMVSWLCMQNLQYSALTTLHPTQGEY